MGVLPVKTQRSLIYVFDWLKFICCKFSCFFIIHDHLLLCLQFFIVFSLVLIFFQATLMADNLNVHHHDRLSYFVWVNRPGEPYYNFYYLWPWFYDYNSFVLLYTDPMTCITLFSSFFFVWLEQKNCEDHVFCRFYGLGSFPWKNFLLFCLFSLFKQYVFL